MYLFYPLLAFGGAAAADLPWGTGTARTGVGPFEALGDCYNGA